MLSTAAGAGVGFLMFVVSIVVAGLLLANAAGGSQVARAFATRLAAERGEKLVELAGATVRSVARGILGVALIQSLLAGLGCLAVGMADAFLKPLLMGRGVDVPMIVIFIGAIGGFMTSGIIGLFVGAIILALGYKIFLAWLNDDAPPQQASGKSD